jgi:hypothetical protein
MRNVSTTAVEKLKTHFIFQSVFLENRAVYEMWKKNCRAGQASDENVTHAHCMLDT